MKSICGADCAECTMNKECRGCEKTGGCPFGKQCFIAQYIKTGGSEKFEEFKAKLIDEFNNLSIPGMPKISELYALKGNFVNLAYPLPSGECIKMLDDNAVYLGNQAECEFDDGTAGKCYGLVAAPSFLLVSEYGKNGSDPEIIVYKRR